MSVKKNYQLSYLPLSFIALIVVVSSFFYFYNVVRQNKIAAQNLRVERTINEFNYCHVYFLTGVKEYRGYQLKKQKNI